MYKQIFLISLLFILTLVNCNRGPIGYELFRNLDRVSELRSGVHTKQFSSFDRQGGNADGGPFDCIKTLTNGHCILAEYIGAGEIDSIWMTRDNGVFNKTGKIVVELDGIVVLDDRLQDILDGRIGPPFIWPLVGNGDDTSGGGVIKIPMPFKRSMRITVDTNPNYYHVTYRTFSDSTNINTFDPTDPGEDVLKSIKHFGLHDPKPVKMNSKLFKTDIANTVAGETTVIFEQANASGEIREIQIQIPGLVRSPRAIDDGRAFGQNGWSEFYASIDPRNTQIRITRLLDPNVHNQIASIKIDGQQAGVWNSSKNKEKGGDWSEETVLIDPGLTKNKSTINVKQEYIQSTVDFNEFLYEIQSQVNGQWIRTDVIDVGPNHPGDEGVHRYHIENQTYQGQRVFRYEIEPKDVQKSDELLAKSRIRATFDNVVTVDAPIGQFFGSGLGMYDTRSLWFSIDARNAVFRTFWPMPFAKQAKIELVFGSSSNLIVNSSVLAISDSNIKSLLDSKNIGYFHATHNDETTTPGHDYIFLNTSGRGVFYGVSHTMHGLIKTGNLRDYLEGDERVFIDGKQTPEIYGTGTEDFYESGWYFRGGITFNMPLNGNSGYETTGDDCLYDCTQAIRIYLGGVSFESGIVFGIEHGPVDDNEPGQYSSVAYWYGSAEPVIKQTDMVNVINETSRTQHSYKVEGELKYDMNSSYEGESYKKLIQSFVTSATKQMQFEVSIDANNNGIRIFRTSDQNIAYQCVDVYVNEHLIGQWLQPLGNKWSRFLDDSYDLAASVTKGQSKLSLKLVPVSHDGGPVIWSAISYKIMSII